MTRHEAHVHTTINQHSPPSQWRSPVITALRRRQADALLRHIVAAGGAITLGALEQRKLLPLGLSSQDVHAAVELLVADGVVTVDGDAVRLRHDRETCGLFDDGRFCPACLLLRKEVAQ